MTEPDPPHEDASPSDLDDSGFRDLPGLGGPDDEVSLDFANQKMLSEVKANLLGTPLPIQHIGRFRVISKIGQGAMGTVYEADDDRLRRKVALKLLHRESGSDRERRARLQREAQALAQLSHPNLVQVYEVGEHEGQLFMVMELVPGKTLDEVQADAPTSDWRRTLALYLMAGAGLAAAHAKNVVHRDFKPHNVIVDDTGAARVVDFGLARGTLEDQEPTTEIPALAGGAIERPPLERLTASGDMPGTPRFMAPELLARQPATPASDQYSFCVALYEAIYGQYPFEGTSLQQILSEAEAGRVRPPPELQPTRPRWLLEAVRRGLAPKPEDRHSSLEALLAELGKDRQRKWRLMGIGLVILAAASGSWWMRGRVGDGADALAAEQRRIEHARSCEQSGEQMRAAWNKTRDELVPARLVEENLRDLEAEQFIATWEDTCLDDFEGAHDYCRSIARRTYDALVNSGDAGPLPADIFYSLAHNLESCVEAWPKVSTESCAGPGPESEATDRLVEAQLAYERDDMDSALRLAELAEQSAKAEQDKISLIRALLQRGVIYERQEDLERARSVLNEGLELATQCHIEAMMVEFGLERIEVESLHGGNEDATAFPLAMVGGILARPSMQDLLLHRAQYHMKEGGVRLYLEDQCSEAMAAFEIARELLDTVVADKEGSEHRQQVAARTAADARLNIANTRLAAHTSLLPQCTATQSEDGILAEYREARKRHIAATGSDDHFGLAEFEFDEAVAYLTFGRPAEAIERFEAALNIYRRTLGAESKLVGEVHRGLAAAYYASGDLDAALSHARANLVLYRGAPGGEPLVLSEARDTVGVLLRMSGEPNTAIRHHEEAIHALQSSGRSLTNLEQKQLVFAHVNLAAAAWDAGDVDAAEDAMQGARQPLDAISSLDDLPLLLLIEARVRRTRGNYAGAQEALDAVDLDELSSDEADLGLDVRWERLLLLHARRKPLAEACRAEVPALLRALEPGSTDLHSRALREQIERWQQSHC